jgi:hypothetical protein
MPLNWRLGPKSKAPHGLWGINGANSTRIFGFSVREQVLGGCVMHQATSGRKQTCTWVTPGVNCDQSDITFRSKKPTKENAMAAMPVLLIIVIAVLSQRRAGKGR